MSQVVSQKDYMPVKIQIDVDEKFYLKSPTSSELGVKILSHSVAMIDEMGFEAFTFKKLAGRIGASEPSVYRYFESKHKLLLYLLSWYWNWMDYNIMLATQNVDAPEERLRIAIKLLSQSIRKDPNFAHIDEAALYNIVVAESSKVYLIKSVDIDNKEGLFISYKRLCKRVAAIVREINPDYQYPSALISTVVESSHDQKFFAEHLPSLTDIKSNRLNDTTNFLTDLVFNAIKS